MLRARRNAFHDRWADRPQEMTDADRKAYADAAAAGDTDTAAVIIGEAADLVHATQPADQIATRIAEDARGLLATAPDRLWPRHRGEKHDRPL